MKVAVPTDDGVRISKRFSRAAAFVVADVALGEIKNRQVRANPVALANRRTLRRGRQKKSVYRVVPKVISDCRAVIAWSVGQRMRQSVEKEGIEVILTSEPLVDRALALFSLAALQDESKWGDPEQQDPDMEFFRDSGDELDG